MRRRSIDISAVLGGMTTEKKQLLVRDLCGETYNDDDGPFRFLRVCEDGVVKRCRMCVVVNPVTSCTLDEAVRIIVTQSSDHPMVKVLLWNAA